ncbi:hypothetical protein EX895_003804 [Sporisorium graminicola]|uniref:Uncharacterized protein n=1 Tax=Sporisorium graminicola TaxID=280036 RepID=A0A4U7KSW4_9BASI|nr:hypothetical protein EX895_003804 [Sporisorium graminicola]TKY87127.1 hypothetical protein EX895_003804 [Sporisorium graminicola]
MKLFASLLLVVLATVVAVQASVQPTPAPRVEKRQNFDPNNLSQYTNPAALSSLSNFINSQFGSLESMSLGGDQSSFLASQKSKAYSYLSVASSLAANGGTRNPDASSILNSITRTAGGAFSSADGAAASALSSVSAAQASAASKAGSSSSTATGSPNAAAAASTPGYVVGMVACTFVAALAGAFAL